MAGFLAVSSLLAFPAASPRSDPPTSCRAPDPRAASRSRRPGRPSPEPPPSRSPTSGLLVCSCAGRVGKSRWKSRKTRNTWSVLITLPPLSRRSSFRLRQGLHQLLPLPLQLLQLLQNGLRLHPLRQLGQGGDQIIHHPVKFPFLLLLGADDLIQLLQQLLRIGFGIRGQLGQELRISSLAPSGG